MRAEFHGKRLAGLDAKIRDLGRWDEDSSVLSYPDF